MESNQNISSDYSSKFSELFKLMHEEKDEKEAINRYGDLLDHVINEAKKVGKERMDHLKKITDGLVDQIDTEKKFDKDVFWEGVMETFSDYEGLGTGKYKITSYKFWLRLLIILIIGVLAFAAIITLAVVLGD